MREARAPAHRGAARGVKSAPGALFPRFAGLVWTNSMSKEPRQHYIPLFYLRRLVDETCPPGQEPYLWVYRKGQYGAFRRAPKNTACALHFYFVETTGGERDCVAEELLSSIESCAARIWHRSSDRDLCLSSEERGAAVL